MIGIFLHLVEAFHYLSKATSTIIFTHMNGKGTISPKVLLIEDYNKDFMRIEHLLDVLQELKILSYHTEHQNSLNFHSDESEELPAMRIMYMNKNYLAAIYFGENALMLQTAMIKTSEPLVAMDTKVNSAQAEEEVDLLQMLELLFSEMNYHPTLHN